MLSHPNVAVTGYGRVSGSKLADWDSVELIAVLNTCTAVECGVNKDTDAGNYSDERSCKIVSPVSGPDDGTASPE